MYVYLQSESNLWTVGFYDPKGNWVAESDHISPAKAAERVAWLNGSGKDLRMNKETDPYVQNKDFPYPRS